jgi:hypothetical protein
MNDQIGFHSRLHPISTRLNLNEYADLAEFSVRNGVMMDSAVGMLLRAGLKSVQGLSVAEVRALP